MIEKFLYCPELPIWPEIKKKTYRKTPSVVSTNWQFHLMSVELDILDKETCLNSFSERLTELNSETIKNGMFCAEPLNNFKV